MMSRVPPTIPFLMVYPAGHDLAGKDIKRDAICSRCGKAFVQYRINPPWLNSFKSHSPRALDELLKTCEVERIDGEKHVFMPARCAVCDRKSLLPGDLEQFVR